MSLVVTSSINLHVRIKHLGRSSTTVGEEERQVMFFPEIQHMAWWIWCCPWCIHTLLSPLVRIWRVQFKTKRHDKSYCLTRELSWIKTKNTHPLLPLVWGAGKFHLVCISKQLNCHFLDQNADWNTRFIYLKYFHSVFLLKKNTRQF